MAVELLVVCGVDADGVGLVLERVGRSGTAVVHHDLREVAGGVVRRRIRLGRSDTTTVLELAHGCLSCTLREDLLPVVRMLARADDVSRIVLHLDPVLEPERVCWALHHVLLDGAPVTEDVDVRGVVAVLDGGTWLADATSADEVTERGLAELPDDERTIAQLVVGQAEQADLLVVTGTTEPEPAARTAAVLARLAPLAHRLTADRLDSPEGRRRLLLDDLPAGARRGVPDDAHSALLRGQPPLGADGDVGLVVFTARRPFAPQRLHEAIDVLLDGVVRTRGRVWLATRPDAVLWVESAGGGLQIGHAGDWLAVGDDADWSAADPQRRAAAALRWHPRWGDRVQELTVLACGADPDAIEAALRGALLTDAELADEASWAALPDPFGSWHEDPCDDVVPATPRPDPRHRKDPR